MAAISEWDLFAREQFKFSPMSHELIGNYLKRRILGELDPKSAPIVELEMYGKEKSKSPWNLFGGDDLPWQKNSTVLYVFTLLANVGKTPKSSSKQKNRVAGDGKWKKSKEVPVLDGNNIREIGYRRTLAFESEDKSHGHWNMDEFAINPAAFPGELQGHCQNLVLCRISCKSSDDKVLASSRKRKVLASSRKRKSAVVVLDDDSCISDVRCPCDLMEEASSKRQKLTVPQEQEQTAYVPNWADSEYVPINFDIPETEFADDCYISLSDLE